NGFRSTRSEAPEFQPSPIGSAKLSALLWPRSSADTTSATLGRWIVRPKRKDKKVSAQFHPPSTESDELAGGNYAASPVASRPRSTGTRVIRRMDKRRNWNDGVPLLYASNARSTLAVVAVARRHRKRRCAAKCRLQEGHLLPFRHAAGLALRQGHDGRRRSPGSVLLEFDFELFSEGNGQTTNVALVKQLLAVISGLTHVNYFLNVCLNCGSNPGIFRPFPSRPPPRHHGPYLGQPDYRIYEMNKRLQQRTEESDNLWWDAFATEFFEDDATLTLTLCLEDGPKRYTVGRTLIPRYFRSIFEGGVCELQFQLKHARESFHQTAISLDCDQAYMLTTHGKPAQLTFSGARADPLKDQSSRDSAVLVATEGRLMVEFTFDDLMRIRSWHFATRTHRELVPRALIALHQDPQVMDQMSKNCTRQGLTNSTLNYLRLCVILEPMQELMSRHKAYALSPRDCLKTTLFQKWQRMCQPPGEYALIVVRVFTDA
ncbi:LIM domain-binding protein 2-like, partial [Tropilaelaps mercedesae]